MKKIRLCIFVCVFFAQYQYIHAQNVVYQGITYKIDTLFPASGTTGLNYPWEVAWGPDDSLWVTEARGYTVKKINVRNKGTRQVLDISAGKNFIAGGKWPQGGMQGLAFHPNFNSGSRYVYIGYVYTRNSCPAGSNPCFFSSMIVRYQYPDTGPNRFTLTNPDTLLTNLPGSNDHNSGRLAVGPDNKVYYTIGDMGAGQFDNATRTQNAQNLNVYEGKVLRLNCDPDPAQSGGDEWIPDDNPFPATGPVTNKTAVYSYGHRNAQGLVWANVGGTNRLFSSEHGDRSDDEVNVIEAGRNYGWPYVSGKNDGNYDSVSSTDYFTQGTKKIIREDTFCTNHNVRLPLFSFFAWSHAAIRAVYSNSDIFTWPTIAPSSIDYYGGRPRSIPGWNNSLLVTSLKYGLYRLKLNSAGDAISGDTIPMLHGNRVRDVAINPAGDTLYFAIDKSGSTSGPTGGFSGGPLANTPNPGFILRMVTMTILPLDDKKEPFNPHVYLAQVKLYPNPTSKLLTIETGSGLRKPLRAVLYDITGKLMLEQSSTRDKFSINVQSLRHGVYIVKVFNGVNVNVTTEKIVIQ